MNGATYYDRNRDAVLASYNALYPAEVHAGWAPSASTMSCHRLNTSGVCCYALTRSSKNASVISICQGKRSRSVSEKRLNARSNRSGSSTSSANVRTSAERRFGIYKLGLLVGYLEGIGSERGITDRGTTNCKRDTDACRTGAISSRRK